MYPLKTHSLRHLTSQRRGRYLMLLTNNDLDKQEKEWGEGIKGERKREREYIS